MRYFENANELGRQNKLNINYRIYIRKIMKGNEELRCNNRKNSFLKGRPCTQSSYFDESNKSFARNAKNR